MPYNVKTGPEPDNHKELYCRTRFATAWLFSYSNLQQPTIFVKMNSISLENFQICIH